MNENDNLQTPNQQPSTVRSLMAIVTETNRVQRQLAHATADSERALVVRHTARLRELEAESAAWQAASTQGPVPLT